ncbi:hypothetical protein OG218_13745 [Kineococcus sp. NBC_00420]|uniref:hypothetical protein n=1 Tax=Kineococcus sp. NBC_00420 TaxID=2903564 RepID=UPI002E24CADF
MLSHSDLPGRTIHVIAPRQVNPSWPDPIDRARAVVATLDVLRPVTASLVIDLAADRWVEHGSSLSPIEVKSTEVVYDVRRVMLRAIRPSRPAS